MPYRLNHYATVKGFTLIEVMIAVAVVAILAGVGWPMFEKQMARQQVSDAVISLTKIQTQMEKCLLDKGTYTGCTPCGSADAPSKEGNYKITVACSSDGGKYYATAVPNSTTYGQQPLALSSLGHKVGPWP